MQTETYITDPIEIAAYIDTLAQRRIRGDLKVSGGDATIRVIFLGHGGEGDGSYVQLERLVPLGALNRLDIGKEVVVEYMEDGVAFSFESRSIDIEDRDGCIRLGFPANITKSQRRRFFRVYPDPPPPIFEVVINTDRISAKCTVDDISAGGLSFFTDIENNLLKPGSEIGTLSFTLPDGYIVKARGVLRSHIPTIDPSPKKRYRCGVEFIGITENVQDKIVNYVFSRQKEEIKRRKERK